MDLFEHAATSARIRAAIDLLEHPRHSIDAKGRAWLRAELEADRAELEGKPRKAEKRAK